MEWFLTTFLPSIEQRMNNPKYPNQAIITRNQFDVCGRYFHPVQCHGDYGWFTVYEFATDDAKYLITFKGKYIFLNKYPTQEDPAHKAEREAEQNRIKAERIARTKRNPERLAWKIAKLSEKLERLQAAYQMELDDEADEDELEYYREEIAEVEKELALYTHK